jgi:hypothetical protein
MFCARKVPIPDADSRLTVRPSLVPQSSSPTTTSCATSKSRRVRYPAFAVLSAVSERPLREPCVVMKYSMGETFFHRLGDWELDRLACWRCDEAFHTGHLGYLCDRAAGARLEHVENWAVLVGSDAGHELFNLGLGSVPDLDVHAVALLFRKETFLPVSNYFVRLLLCSVNDACFSLGS